jgi:hypothetical protein
MTSRKQIWKAQSDRIAQFWEAHSPLDYPELIEAGRVLILDRGTRQWGVAAEDQLPLGLETDPAKGHH